MKLILIGGVAATKLQGILLGSTDNINISVYPTIDNFMDNASMQNVYADRFFLLQDAYEAIEGDKHASLEHFSTFLVNNYPNAKLICLGSKEPILQEFSSVFISPDYATFSMSRGSARFLCDCAQNSVDSLMETYASVLRKSSVEIAGQAPVQQTVQPTAPTPAPAPQVKEKKTSIFSRKRNTSNNAGQSPAAPLTPSQNAGLGQNQDSSGSFSSGANTNINPFGQPQAKTNVFNRGAQNATAPQPAQAPAVKKPNIFNRGSQAPAQPNAAQMPAQAPSSAPARTPAQAPVNTNPFGGQANNNFNPFARGAAKPKGTAPAFGAVAPQAPAQSAPVQGNVNPFGAPATPAQSVPDDSFDSMGAAAFGATEFDSYEEVEEVDTSSLSVGTEDIGQFGANTQFPSDSSFFGSSESSFGAPSNSANTAQNFGSSGFGQDAFGGGNINENYGAVGRNLPQPDFNSPMGNQNFGTSAFGGDSSQGFAPVAPNPVISRPQPPVEAAEPITPFDKSKLQGKVRKKFDFVHASQVDLPRQDDIDIEESAFGGGSTGFYDDSAYNAQFAQPAKIQVIEREVYVDSGTDIATLKLLEGGKNVVLIVTGDRRSGVTYTVLTIAEMFSKRYRTLVVDLDNETCGGQLYQDIDALMEEEENVKYGAKHVKNPKMLMHMIHHDMTSNYDYLFSLLGTPPITLEEAHNTANVLLYQRDYNFVIVDCPWSKIKAMEDLAPNSKILICVDGNDIGGCYNIVRLLNDLPPSSRVSAAMERNAAYIGKHGGSVQNLMTNMKWVSGAFDTQGTDWTKLRILGSSDKADLQNILSKF